MRRITAICSFLLVPLSVCVFAQTKLGTIAVVRYTDAKIIIAADSRHTLGKDKTSKHDDYGCKIAALGRHIVMVTAGFAGYNAASANDQIPTWGASELAHQAYRESKNASKHRRDHDISLRDVAARWGELVRAHIAALQKVNARSVTNAQEAGLLTTAIFAGTDTNRGLTVLLVQIKIAPEMGGGIQVEGPKLITPSVCPPCALGKTSIFLEFFERRTTRAREEARRWQKIISTHSVSEADRMSVIRLVELTISLASDSDRDSVGGPIDAVELRRGEAVTWIQRKSQCPAD
jgi:hypothetical protein